MIRKAAFFDLDGTLAVNDQPASDAVTQAIRAFRANGNLVILSTGRATAHVYSSILDIGFDGMIAGAGAYVSLGEHELYKRLMSPELIRRIILYFLKDGHTCVLEGEKSLYVVNQKQGWESAWPEITDADSFEPGKGRFAGQGVYKFTAYVPVPNELKRLVGDEMTIIDHHRYAEVVPSGCSKAQGIRRVLEAAGMTRENSIAFGDSRNDIDMLQYAGLGIAMGDSPEPVLQAADRVTGTLAQDGVAQVLREMMAETGCR